MSRIGKLPVEIPAGVTVTVAGSTVTVKGPKGQLTRTFNPAVTIATDGKTVTVTRPSDEEVHKSLHGLSRTLVANMVEGVTKGYTRQLYIQGTGYKAELKPYGLLLGLGFSHQIEFKAPEGIKLSTGSATVAGITVVTVTIEGADKEIVGQVAAEIRSLRKAEPYKGKGVRYADEVIRRKAGKAGAK